MATVVITADAQREFEKLPLPIQARVRAVFARLQSWPDVSGAKPLRGDLAGSSRIRTGDYRVIFKPRGDDVVVWKIGYRGGVYD
jgi:mRNA-degrading endonuclease RelE of RelBE toxin-antitoxin system